MNLSEKRVYQSDAYGFDEIEFLSFLNLLQEKHVVQCFFAKFFRLYLKISIGLDTHVRHLSTNIIECLPLEIGPIVSLEFSHYSRLMCNNVALSCRILSFYSRHDNNNSNNNNNNNQEFDCSISYEHVKTSSPWLCQ
jgi:hypothetical protein